MGFGVRGFGLGFRGLGLRLQGSGLGVRKDIELLQSLISEPGHFQTRWGCLTTGPSGIAGAGFCGWGLGLLPPGHVLWGCQTTLTKHTVRGNLKPEWPKAGAGLFRV